jgi:hypothetical protein
MSIQPVKIRAVDALLPSTLIDLAKTDEKAMRVTATLVLNLFNQLIRLVRDDKIQPLDAFPGDRYCQGRVVIVPELVDKSDVREELKELEVKVSAALEALRKREGTHQPSSSGLFESAALEAFRKRGGQHTSSCSDFFEKEIAALTISSDVRYLMDCRLLMITRQLQPPEPSGRRISKSEPANLTKLSKKFQDIVENKQPGKNFLEQITQNASTRISAETVERMQEYSRKMKIPPLLRDMIEEFVIFKPDGYPPKSFGCQLFTLQLALCHLLEKKTPIAIKTIVPKGDRQLIFLKQGKMILSF